MTDFRRKLDAINEEKEKLRRRSDEAWKRSRFLAWFGLCLQRGFNGLFSPSPRPPVPEDASESEQIFRHGQKGEKSVIQRLLATTPQDWVLVSGYQNRAGETDILLVTPNGIAAIEVKNWSGTIRCSGDQWTRSREYFAKGGKGRKSWKTESLQDKGGRSPARQVNAVSDGLENFFMQRALRLKAGKIQRWVVLPMENANFEYNPARPPDVNLVVPLRLLTVDILRRRLQPRQEPLDVPAVLEKIRQDHQFWTKRRAKRPSTATRSAGCSRSGDAC
jgi:hypothetical protein